MADPLKLFLNCFLAALILAIFLLKPLGFAFKPCRIIALKRNAATTIKLKHPANDIIKEVTIMGNEDDVAGIFDQMVFKPLNAFGVQMVGRFIEQQHLGLFEQQTAQRDAAALPA